MAVKKFDEVIDKIKANKPKNPLESVGETTAPLLANYMENKLNEAPKFEDIPASGPSFEDIKPSVRRYGPSEDTWDYVLSKGGRISDLLPMPQRSQYDGITSTIKNKEEFEDRLTANLYMASLAQVPPDLAWNIDAEMSRFIFNKKQMSPKEIVSAAIKDQKTIGDFGKAWNRMLAELPEMPTWFEDVVVNQLASSIASMKSTYYQTRANMLDSEDFTAEQLATGMHNPYFGRENAGAKKLLRDKQIDYQAQARLLWQVSKDPKLALKRDDILNQLFAMAVQTGPYITVTTGATMAAGPFGGFVAGSTMMGNTAYQKAVDKFTAENNGKPLTPEQERLAGIISFGVGVFSGGVEVAGGGIADKYVNIITEKITNKYLAKGVEFGLSSLIEGLEEGSQEIFDIAGESVYQDIDWNDATKRTLVAMGGGVALGGAYGMGRRAFGSVFEQNISDNQRRQMRFAAAQEQLRAETVLELENNIDESVKAQEKAQEGPPEAAGATKPPEAAPTTEAAPAPEGKGEGKKAGEREQEIRSGQINTIAGKMDLTEFERMGYEPSEVTQSDWIALQRAERRRLGQQEIGDNPRVPWAEYEEYHKDAVKRAVEAGDEVDTRVLEEYKSEKWAQEALAAPATEKEIFKFMTPEEQERAYRFAIESGDFEGSKDSFSKGMGNALFNPQTGEIIESGGTVIHEEPIRTRSVISKELTEQELIEQDRIRLKKSGIGQGRFWEYRNDKGVYTVAPNKEEAIKRANIAQLPATEVAPATEVKPEQVKLEEQAKPERKVSRLAQRVEETAVEAKLTESLGELPTYETMNMAEQSKLATELVNTDPDRAMRVAMGRENAPGNLRNASVFETVKYKALKEQDVETLRRLATESTLPSELSALGQQIKAADTGRVADPIKAAKKITKTRETAVKKRTGKDPKKQRKEWAKSAKEKIRKQVTKRKSWDEFVESIRC